MIERTPSQTTRAWVACALAVGLCACERTPGPAQPPAGAAATVAGVDPAAAAAPTAVTSAVAEAQAVTATARSDRAPRGNRKPTLWSRIADWPDPVAVVDGTPIARKDLVSDLQAAVDTGVLPLEVDETTGMRAAATALEARVDALIVAHALRAADQPALKAETQRLRTLDVAQAGGEEPWRAKLKRMGQSPESRERNLQMRAGLNVLSEQIKPVTVTDSELKERYAHIQKELRPEARKTQTYARMKPQLISYVRGFRLWEAGRTLLLRLRGQAKVQRQSPFDHPPGGLPIAGDVTPAEFEEDDD